MPTHPAVRQNGVCRGTLWKQHCSSLPASDDGGNQGNKNEREKRQEYCILVGNTLSSFPDEKSVGEYPSSEIRIVGASAWNPPTPKNSTSSGAKSFTSPTRNKSSDHLSKEGSATSSTHTNSSPTFRIVTYSGTHVYCTAPSTTDRDVWLTALHSGLEASYATDTQSTDAKKSTCGECMKSFSPPYNDHEYYSEDSSSIDSSSTEHSDIDSSSFSSNDDSTDGGGSSNSDPWTPPKHPPSKHNTHRIPITKPRSSYVRKPSLTTTNSLTTMQTMQPPKPPGPKRNKYCHSCGMHSKHPSINPSEFVLYNNAVPLPQYSIETRVEYICRSCLVAQGVLSHVREWNGLYSSFNHEAAAMRAARGMAVAVVTKAVSTAPPKRGPKDVIRDNNEDTSTMDRSIAVNIKPMDASGVGGQMDGSWENIPIGLSMGMSSALNPNNAERIMEKRRNMNDNGMGKNKAKSETALKETNTGGFAFPGAAGGSSWHHVSPSDAGTKSLLQLLQTPGFATFRRRSRALEIECRKLETGLCSGAAEFLDILEGICGPMESDSSDGKRGSEQYHRDNMELKKQAFKVSGDISITIKLLYDHALGVNVINSETNKDNSCFISTTTTGNNIYMLQCILEFLLDLCEEGELAAVAFYWPQLCHVHLQMLPPTNADELMRVELMEDFLLTVAAKHSVQLALELVWGLIADLEEAMQFAWWANSADGDNVKDGTDGSCGIKCRRRRFCVIRFVCEIESILFDFDGGWGGGSVALRGILAPSEHQAIIIRDSMITIQSHRIKSPHYLTRSIRRDKLRRETLPICPICKSDNSRSSLTRKEKRGVIISNADYFSAQLLFARKLGDIAERLRFLDHSKRELALVNELESLNRTLGNGRRIVAGDPLSRAGDGVGLAKVVKMASKEGHVFRSKERTPVLLLMEVIRKVVQEDAKLDSKDSTTPDAIETDTRKKDDISKNIDVTSSSYADALFGSDAESKSFPSSSADSRILNDDHVKMEGVSLEPKPDQDDENATLDKINEMPTADTSQDMPFLIPSNGTEPEKESLPIPPIIPSPPVTPTMGHKTPRIIRRLDGSSPNISIQTSPLNAHAVVHDISHQGSSSGDKEVEDLVASAMQEQLNFHDTSSSLRLPKLEQLGLASDAEKSAKEENSTCISKDKRTPCTNVPVVPNIMDEPPSSIPSKQKNGMHMRVQQVNKTIRKMSTLGSNPLGVTNKKLGMADNQTSTNSSTPAHAPLAVFGEGRREVLTTILQKGMNGNVIAKGAAAAAQRAVQAMDRKRALEHIQKEQDSLSIGGDDSDTVTEESCEVLFPNRDGEENTTKGVSSLEAGDGTESPETREEDEAMESLRIVLIQNRVAQGKLSPAHAAMALGPVSNTRSLSVTQKSTSNNSDARTNSNDTARDAQSNSQIPNNVNDDPNAPLYGVDAGKIDPRLAGCGPLSPAILSAVQLWKEGVISNGELLELARKDQLFLRHLPGADNSSKLIEDSAFWVRFAFGERFAEKKARIAAQSIHGTKPGWDLISVIVKSNDDLRQEAFVMQLIELCQDAFDLAGLELWVQPYRILATSRSTGIIETLKNALSFDSLKKRPGYENGGLLGHFKRMSEFAANPDETFKEAQHNFVRSLSAYSLLSYLFMFKDRHNGNLLLDTAGHVIHIDFGFVFGTAPGGSFSLEVAPFKLTDEMVEVMGGLGSPLFSEFVTLFCCGFLALQTHMDTFLTLVEITCKGSPYPCFAGRDSSDVVEKLRERFCPQLDKASTVVYALDLIKQSVTSYGTRQYDFFQYLSQGIAT